MHLAEKILQCRKKAGLSQEAPGYAFGEIYDPIGGQSPMIGSMNSAMNAMAQNNPVSILGGVMIVLGIVLILGGVALAIVLRRWGGKKS